ncbi:MAG: AhpC/TSA family protein [Actinobacteria bacterium]|nr:AhpC/TSA family protein [Actinomycetota bacterium]
MTAALAALTAAAEEEWLERWTAGPVEAAGKRLVAGAAAPDLVLPDHEATPRALSEFWSERPALVMFWRHFGCSCGAERAARLVAEYPAIRDAGLEPVIVGQGEPERARAYRVGHALPCAVLCDPTHEAYRAWGLGQWPVERVLFDAPAEYWTHPAALGRAFQDDRRRTGVAPVDDPWRAVGEFVVGTDGTVLLDYAYQYCEDFPDIRVFTTAARRA